MKLLKYIVIFFLVSSCATLKSQEKLSDKERVEILPYVSDQIEYLPLIAKNNLQSKLAQIVSSNGFGSSEGYRNRFIITPNISVLDKFVVSGTIPKIAMTLEIALFVGDGVTGIKYGNTSLTTKGVGRNETKAFLSAIKNISPKNKNIISLLENSKGKILSYYNDCELVLADVDKYIATENYDYALGIINSIPKVSKDCYNKALAKVKPIYKKKIDYDCENLLLKAKNEWNAGLNLTSAKASAGYLNKISPYSSCYKEVLQFVETVNKKLKKDEEEAWDFVIEKEKSYQQLKESEILAFKEVAVERAKNPPINTYNVKGWW